MTPNQDKVVEFFKNNPGHLKTASHMIAKRLGVGINDVFEGRNKYKNEYVCQGETKTPSEKIKEKLIATQYQEFLEKHGIDESKVVSVYHKEKSDGVRFTVQQSFRSQEEEFDHRQAAIEHLKEYQDVVKPVDKLSRRSHSIHKVAVINIFDVHIDKISFLSETDEENTLESNIEKFESVFEELLYFVSQSNPELILFPISGDLFQTNDENLTTKRGTDQKHNQSSDPKGAFKQTLSLIRRCIDKAKQVADVKVLSLRGNHDEDKMFYFAATLEVAYEKDKNVTVVDGSRKQRIYERYGRWLFGFAHGNLEKNKVKELPSLMSTDQDSRKHWSEIKQGIFFLGDIHHEKEYEFLRTQDFRGCKVKFLRGLTGTDKWHTDEGWTGIAKTAYADVYDRDSGRVVYNAIDI